PSRASWGWRETRTPPAMRRRSSTCSPTRRWWPPSPRAASSPPSSPRRRTRPGGSGRGRAPATSCASIPSTDRRTPTSTAASGPSSACTAGSTAPRSRRRAICCAGALVADLHRSLIDGGLYFYPADSAHASGKLRLMYECAPLAFVVEQAGGRASTGMERILDVQAGSIHQRVPFVIGSVEDVILY